jgi:hypothetical protein
MLPLVDMVMRERFLRLDGMTLCLVTWKLIKDSFEIMKGSTIVFPSVNIESILCTQKVELCRFSRAVPVFHGENPVRPGKNQYFPSLYKDIDDMDEDVKVVKEELNNELKTIRRELILTIYSFLCHRQRQSNSNAVRSGLLTSLSNTFCFGTRQWTHWRSLIVCSCWQVCHNFGEVSDIIHDLLSGARQRPTCVLSCR